MIEILTRKLVITRKEHECFGCLQKIEKGVSAVSVRAQEDDQYINLHLHQNCNSIINQNKKDIILSRGCVTADLVNKTKIVCYWCVNEIEGEQTPIMGYGKFGAMYFCSDACKEEERLCPF